MVARLDSTERDRLLTSLGPEQLEKLRYDWRFWARPNQLPPKLSQGKVPWRVWLLLAGRGFGKTRCGAEWVRGEVERAGVRRVALVAPTAADARDTMVLGESGLLNVCPPWNMPKYEPSKRRVVWPNGAYAMLFSADEPDRLRGLQHEIAWCDELASWQYPEAWDMLLFGLRLGKNPRAVVTTTPKPIKLVRELLVDRRTAITKGSTFDNRDNLAEAFFDDILKKYEGTRLGRQEIYAEVLDDIPGALWTEEILSKTRVMVAPKDLVRVVVAIDPAVSSGDNSCEHGIVVAGRCQEGHAYVLEDGSLFGTPDEWARQAKHLYDKYKADLYVAEKNNGGDLVEANIRTVDPNAKIELVHASRGKVRRAEPVAALYEQGKVHHVGRFKLLEDQLCVFTSDFDVDRMGFSPDRADALVWAVTKLLVEPGTDAMIEYYRLQVEKLKCEQRERAMEVAA